MSNDKWKMVLLTRAEPLSVLRRRDECLHHFRIAEVSAKAVQLIQPEVESRRVRITTQITEVLHRNESPVELEVRGIGRFRDLAQHSRASLSGRIESIDERVAEHLGRREVTADFTAAELRGVKVDVRAASAN